MVWIIPKNDDSTMLKQLICLMANIESNRTLFDTEGKFNDDPSKNNKPFNVYENDYFTDEYRFIKGYLQFTGSTVPNNVLSESLNSVNLYMPNITSIDINYCYPTAHYTVARKPRNKEYNRIIIQEGQRIKGIRHKYHFIWVSETFKFNNFTELRSKTQLPETYELMRALSTIIYDNAGIFEYTNTGEKLTKMSNNINFPEFWQVVNSKRIINKTIHLHQKFNIRNDIRKLFEYLIPDTKKFSQNRQYFDDDKVKYSENNSVVIVEKKDLSELNLLPLDRKESIFKRLSASTAFDGLMKLNITEKNKSQLTVDIIIRYLSCHICFTPVYDEFYYKISDIFAGTPPAHIIFCALCIHNYNLDKKCLGNYGISKSPLTVYSVISMVKKPDNMTDEKYEKYKKMMQYLFSNVIQVNSDNSSGELATIGNAKLVSNINSSLLTSTVDNDIYILGINA